jgi:hypothetical protein
MSEFSDWWDDRKEDFEEKLAEVITYLVEVQGFDLHDIWKKSYRSPKWRWRLLAISLGTGGGVTSMLIPSMAHLLPGAGTLIAIGAHGGALFWDLTAIFNQMGVAAYGIGYILAEKHNIGKGAVHVSDFVDILLTWCGAYEHIQSECAKLLLTGGYAGSKIAAKASAKAAAKMSAKAAATGTAMASGILVKGTVAPIVGKVLAKKITVKLGGKISGSIPLAGPVLNGGINGYFVNDICRAAERYYEAKFGL